MRSFKTEVPSCYSFSGRHIRLGEFGDLRFPYPLDQHAASLPPDAAFQRLAALTKQHFGLAAGPARQPKVVIARRRHTRILANASQLLARLQEVGFQPSIVDFAGMTLEEQVRSSWCVCGLVKGLPSRNFR